MEGRGCPSGEDRLLGAPHLDRLSARAVEKGLAGHGAGGRADAPREKIYRPLHVPPSLQEREKLKRFQFLPPGIESPSSNQ